MGLVKKAIKYSLIAIAIAIGLRLILSLGGSSDSPPSTPPPKPEVASTETSIPTRSLSELEAEFNALVKQRDALYDQMEGKSDEEINRHLGSGPEPQQGSTRPRNALNGERHQQGLVALGASQQAHQVHKADGRSIHGPNASIRILSPAANQGVQNLDNVAYPQRPHQKPSPIGNGQHLQPRQLGQRVKGRRQRPSLLADDHARPQANRV